MTHAEQILDAVATLVGQQKETIFTRAEVRQQAGVERAIWTASYSPVLQGMRIDHPGGAPKVGAKYQGVFQRVAYGKYMLTSYGWQLLNQSG